MSQDFSNGESQARELYQAYGVTLRSDVPLPELLVSHHPVDINIQKGAICLPPLSPTAINRQDIRVSFGGTPDDAYLYWPGVAKFRAVSGNTLMVEPESQDINAQKLNLYLLSEALGLLLMQRGLFLLHASAIKVGERACIFVGAGGAGKSTTAAAFVHHGYPLLADDMVAIQFDAQGDAYVVPSFPQLKIWPATAQGLGIELASLPTLFPGSRKRVLRPTANFPQAPVPLAGIFLLEAGATLQCVPTSGPTLVTTLAQFFPCPLGFLQGKALSTYFQKCTHLLNQVEVWTVTHPKLFSDLPRLMAQVIHLLGYPTDQLQFTPVPHS